MSLGLDCDKLERETDHESQIDNDEEEVGEDEEATEFVMQA